MSKQFQKKNKQFGAKKSKVKPALAKISKKRRDRLDRLNDLKASKQRENIRQLPSNQFKTLWGRSCSSAPATYQFDLDDTNVNAFKVMGRSLYWDLFKKKTPTYSEGEFAAYLWGCFCWYLKKNGAWQDMDDDMPSMGQLYLPLGYAKLFQQNSTTKNKKVQAVCSVVSNMSAATATSTLWAKWNDGYNVHVGAANDFSWDDTDASTITWLGVDISGVSEVIKRVYYDSIQTCEVEWGTISGTFKLGIDDTSLFPVFPWARELMLAPTTSAAKFIGHKLTQHVDVDYPLVLCDMMLNSDAHWKTIEALLRINNYDPTNFNIKHVDFNCAYLANIINAVWNVNAGAADADYYRWNMVCWSYVLAYLPTASLAYAPMYVVDPAVKQWKMPWPIMYAAKQLSLKVADSYVIPSLNRIVKSWANIHTGGTSTAYTISDYSNPGFLADTIPGPVYVGATNVDWVPSAGVNYCVASSVQVQYAYSYIVRHYSSLFGIASTMPDSIQDCGCFASHVGTGAIDSFTNVNLGVLNPQAVNVLFCTSPTPAGSCKIAAGLTWRTTDSTRPISTVAKYDTYSNTTAVLNSVASITVSPSQMSVQVAQAAADPTKYIHEQVSGGYEYVKIDEKDIEHLIGDFIAGTPIAKYATKTAAAAAAENLPSFVPVDSLMHFVGEVGAGTAGVISSILAKKAIGFAKGLKWEL